ncbi:MAG: hypothetical protein COA82_04055 [Alkaliphilus sp.]|nr:MAG: hypothetical protein COA82_04055 [Alkaliphilus sp.]
MKLYLQFGWGMKKLVLDLAKTWEKVNVILSPRDITPKQLQNWSGEFEKANVSCLFDPQCYYPKSDHRILSQYSYWNNLMSKNLSLELNNVNSLITNIKEYNDIIGTEKFIVPGIIRKFDEEWFSKWERESKKLVSVSRNIVGRKKTLLTLALSFGVLNQSDELIEKIVLSCEKLDVDGYYIIAEPIEGKYLSDEPLWLSNLLQLCAGLKLLDKEVVVGYANQQLLCLSTAKVDAIASGTYLNVRKFSNKFEKSDTKIKRKSVWYYYPESLSEYKISFLDVAFNNRVLEEMKPGDDYNNEYVNLIFSGIMPQSTNFKESLAFKHYLECLRAQAASCSRESFENTISANEILLTTAERRIEILEKAGVYAQTRSFKDVVDVNRSAIQRLEKTRGFLMKYSWDEL